VADRKPGRDVEEADRTPPEEAVDGGTDGSEGGGGWTSAEKVPPETRAGDPRGGKPSRK
jgi:hypothetical protein